MFLSQTNKTDLVYEEEKSVDVNILDTMLKINHLPAKVNRKVKRFRLTVLFSF